MQTQSVATSVPYGFVLPPQPVVHRATVEVGRGYLAQVRGFEVELYGSVARRSRSGSVALASLSFVDSGEWRSAGYVRWSGDACRDYMLLDDLDQLLRSHFPAGAGTVQRADQPSNHPSVRLSSTR